MEQGATVNAQNKVCSYHYISNWLTGYVYPSYDFQVGWSPLLRACNGGYSDIVAQLLACGANTEQYTQVCVINMIYGNGGPKKDSICHVQIGLSALIVAIYKKKSLGNSEAAAVG